MTALYVVLAVLVLVSGLIYWIYRMAKSKGEKDERNERLRIAVEKAREDRKVAAGAFRSDPLDVMRDLAKK